MDLSYQRQRRIAATSEDPVEVERLLHMHCRANGHRWVQETGKTERHCWICCETQKARFVYGCIYVFYTHAKVKKTVIAADGSTINTIPLEDYVRLLGEVTARCNANPTEFSAIDTRAYEFTQGEVDTLCK